MAFPFAIALRLNPIEITAAVFSGIAFLVMFGVASAKGDFQGLIKSTLENDEANRNRRKND
tara:strand:- start:399 stop:581 length:183 start_codon:yes stop_codon:yes gene_type:complete